MPMREATRTIVEARFVYSDRSNGSPRASRASMASAWTARAAHDFEPSLVGAEGCNEVAVAAGYKAAAVDAGEKVAAVRYAASSRRFG
jgi:hypothetical protein